MHLFHYLERQLNQKRSIGNEKYGNLAITPSDGTNDLQSRALIELRVLGEIPVEQDGAERRVGLDQRQPILRSRGAYDPITLFRSGLAKPFHGTVGYRVRASNFAGD